MKRVSFVALLAFAACTNSSSLKTPDGSGGHGNHPKPTGGYHSPSLIAQDIVWIHLANVTANGGSLTKTSGAPYLADAGATSLQQLLSGDGALELTAAETTTFRFVGLTHQHPDTSGAAIDFSVRLQAGRADAYENGVWRADGTAAAGDLFRVAVESGVVVYSKNGTPFYTSSATPSYPLFAAASLIDAQATVTNARISVGGPQPGTGLAFLDGVTAQPTTDGAVLAWSTTVAASAQADYGASAVYGSSSPTDATLTTSHTVTLGGLAAGTTYHYRARSVDAGGNTALSSDRTFTTLPAIVTGPPPNRHRFCGWVLATGNVTPANDPGYNTFEAHADEFDAIHPAWWHVTGATTFGSVYGVDDPTLMAKTTHGGARTLLIPMIAAVDGTDPTTASTAIGNASTRAQHVQAIVNLVVSHGYDGIDLDYEHLPATDRANLSAFAAALGTALHAAGKTLSFAVGGQTRDGGLYDYDALSQAADQLHIMAYDFHFLGSHPGPVSPLGWVQQIVSYVNSISGGTRSGKFILGLANYGLAGSDTGKTAWFGNSMDSINLAGANYSSVTNHMTSCAFLDPGPTASGLAPNAMTAQGHLFFDDIASHEEKVIAAQNGGLGGITYWTLGGEPDRPGTQTWFQMVRSHFPK